MTSRKDERMTRKEIRALSALTVEVKEVGASHISSASKMHKNRAKKVASNII